MPLSTPEKQKWWEVEHVGHLVSTMGTSFTPEAPERPLTFPNPLFLRQSSNSSDSRITSEIMCRIWPTWWDPFEFWNHSGPASSSGRRKASTHPSYVNNKLHGTIRNSTPWQIMITSSWRLTTWTWSILISHWLGGIAMEFLSAG